MNTEKLISLKENFTGQKFQWIKPDRPELLGKVVKCRDVDFAGDDRYVVAFDDGSKIDSSRLNSNLLMIHGDMQPLTMDEVESIYGVKHKKPAGPSATTGPIPPSFTANPIAQPNQPTSPIQQIKPNMFAMFNSEESQLTLTLNVKIPDKKLLKMMYASSEDKDKFLSELAEHLHAMINKQVVKDSVKSILAPPVFKKEAKPVINLKEVQ